MSNSRDLQYRNETKSSTEADEEYMTDIFFKPT